MSHTFLTQEEIAAKKQAGEGRMIVDPEPYFLVTWKTPPPGYALHHYEHVRATQVHAGDVIELPLKVPEPVYGDTETLEMVQDVWHKQNRKPHTGWTEGVGGVMIELTNGQNITIHDGSEKLWVLRR